MGPTTTLAGIKILGKLLSLGMSAYHAAEGHGVDLDKDVKAIQDLLSTGELAAGFWPPQTPARAQARLVSLVTSAFGQAWRQHFAPRFAMNDPKQLQRHFEAAVQWALQNPQPIGGPAVQLEALAELMRAPEQTGYFRALWQAFCLRRLPDLHAQYEVPLIESVSGDDRRRFEAAFRRACAEALAAPGMRELRDSLFEVARERTQLVRHLLLADLATWGERHVFGNVSQHAALPLMPLDGMYVEPRATLRGKQNDEPLPVLARLQELLRQHHLVVITADFGHGKSLTSRRLARDLARVCLEDKEKLAAELQLPVFIKCLDAMTSDTFELRRMVQRALWTQLQTLHVPLPDNDAALDPPTHGQRTLFIIDGLDEVAFIERGIARLFDHLRGQLVGDHRAVIFSRPHVLPAELEQWGIPVLELAPFSATGDTGGQVGEWLAHWNHYSQRPEVKLAEVQARGFTELAQTPILLFMIAYTWGAVDLGSSTPAPQETTATLPDWQVAELNTITQWRQRDRLYEAFFHAIAWGKHRFDRDRHPQVVKAATKILERLQDSGRLAGPASLSASERAQLLGPTQADGEQQVEAMLWLMSRAAWEGVCLEQKGEALTLRHVENLLADELNIREPGVQKLVCDGLLLALQADLTQGSQRILYGHKSFREFLVARCWESHLSCLVAQSESEGGRRTVSPTAVLQRGRLLRPEDNSFIFLRARLAAWPRSARLKLHRWAERYFNDESIIAAPHATESTDPSVRSDCRLALREASLAIGSAIIEAGGVSADDALTLRTLIGGFWSRAQAAMIWAPGLQSEGANLDGAGLAFSYLAGAELHRASLIGAMLNFANLQDVTLTDAKLAFASLHRTDLTKAYLRGASLVGVICDFADLRGAHLDGANLHVNSMLAAKLEKSQIAHFVSSGVDADRIRTTAIIEQENDSDPANPRPS